MTKEISGSRASSTAGHAHCPRHTVLAAAMAVRLPMMAAAMKNKDVLIPGLTIGVIGYAAGNYLGFLMSQLLGLL